MSSATSGQPTDRPNDPILKLQAFIDERWAVAQPRFYPVAEGPRVQREVSPTEAEFFLASVTAQGGELPLFQVDDERKMRSARFPPRRDGSPLGYLFFEEPGRLRLETIVHIAAAARLRDEFGWPRGIEILTIDARIVIASVDTYLRFAEAVNRLDLESKSEGLPRMLDDKSSTKDKARGAIEGVKEKVGS